MNPAKSVKTSSSSPANLHELVRPEPGVLVLRPAYGRIIKAGVTLALITAPFAFLGWHYLPSDSGNRIWQFWLVPVFAGVGPLVMAVVYRYRGTQLRFDRNRGKLILTRFRPDNGATRALKNIREVQLCAAGMREHRNDHDDEDRGYVWESFQLNLLLDGAGDDTRLNLLDNADEAKLRAMGASIADFLKIPFNDDEIENFAFRQLARKIGRLRVRRTFAIFLLVLFAIFCPFLAGVPGTTVSMPRWAVKTVTVVGIGLTLFIIPWAFRWRLSSFRCTDCGGPLKITRGVKRSLLLVCEHCRQCAPICP